MNAYRKTSRKGFTLVEILIVVIILGILAAIVIPQFTNASEDARKSNMRSQLQTLRSQVELYKLQHRDTPPSLANFWTQMTTRTDETGVAPDAGEDAFGPYLQNQSVNPLTNQSVVDDAPGVAVGWVYDENTGTITGVNKLGAASADGE
jgi:general secretion pathway protein G